MKILLAHEDALLAAGIAATLISLGEFEILRIDASHRGTDEARTADVAIADYQTAIALVGDRFRADRVLIISQAAGEAQIRNALAIGVRGFLLNGCSPQDLVASIHNLRRGSTALAAPVTERIADSLKWEPLTAREQAVMRELISGCCNKTIADRLHISVDTAKTHLKNIMDKLGASNRVEAVAIAQRRGLLAL